MRRSKDELIQIWQDTEKAFDRYPMKIQSFKAKSIFKAHKPAVVKTINQDCIEVAKDLVTNFGKTCMLNMASYKHPGGGVKRGAMAQEEELARRSNMMAALELYEADYPLAIDDLIYLKDVTFFKDGNYQLINPFDCDVITVAAINLNGLERPKNYTSLMLSKISSIFYYAKQEGCRNVVLSAFGCGVFKNDPEEVAELFGSVILQPDVKYSFDNIYFAILNDHNADNDNYKAFKTIFR
jgi:uncharacterized protein (TIGR02452 family)